jgi:hypothetical protein
VDLDVREPLLAKFLQSLPIPLVTLPPHALEAPWLLAVLAHEVGHHAQYELLPKMDAVRETETRIGDAVGHADADRWRPWVYEIFADTYSVLTMGGAALWTIAELTWSPPALFLKTAPRYPSPAARLLLMARVASELGVEVPWLMSWKLRDLAHGDGATELRSAFARDCEVVEDVARAMLEPFDGAGALKDHCKRQDQHFGPSGEAKQIAKSLVGATVDDKTKPQIQLLESVESPRVLAAAGVLAYAKLRTDPPTDGPPPEVRELLVGKHLVDQLPRFRETATRSTDDDTDAQQVGEKYGHDLAKLLLQEVSVEP